MSANNYSLKYRTFDSLFEDVSVDFKNYALEGVINPQTLLKVARKCNYDLGFRIYKTRQIILEVEHGKVRLPDDFHVLNFAVVCGESTVTEALPQGTNIEERLVAPDYVCEPGQPSTCETPTDPCNDPIDPCNTTDPCTGTCITKCGDEYQLIQKINTRTHTYKTNFHLCISDEEYVCADSCATSYTPAGVTGLTPNGKGPINLARIEQGWLMTNFNSGKVYLNYTGDMIDDQGNIMVPDHEMINEYYEYALKERILENLVMNGDNVGDRYALIAQKLRAARNYALTIVNTPNFKELQKIWQVNRKAQYHNYYNMFKSHYPQSYRRYGYNG
jgi:hypothetical protein